MQRFVWQMLFVGGLLACALVPGDTTAQSKKVMSKETVEIAGANSAIFEHWKKEKSEKPVIVKFDLGKPKELEKSEAAELTVIKVEGKKTVQEILSDEVKLIKDEKAKPRDPVDFKAGTLSGKQVFVVGTPAGKTERYRLISTVLDTKDGMYIVRLWGPGQLIGIHQTDVEQFMKAFKPKG